MQSTLPSDVTPIVDSMTNQVFWQDGNDGGETKRDGDSTSVLETLEPNQILQVDLAGRMFCLHNYELTLCVDVAVVSRRERKPLLPRSLRKNETLPRKAGRSASARKVNLRARGRLI